MKQEENSFRNDFSWELRDLREELGLNQAEMAAEIGVKPDYVSKLERGAMPSDPLRILIRMKRTELDLERRWKEEDLAENAAENEEKKGEKIAPLFDARGTMLRDEPELGYAVSKIPVLGWAHAGAATDYEEIRRDSAEWVATDCPDPDAFAVRLEGDSMEPRWTDGDRVVVMPTREMRSGGLVVARFAGSAGGVLFRRVERAGERIILRPQNTHYPTTEHSSEDFAWAYPVWGVWHQAWS